MRTRQTAPRMNPGARINDKTSSNWRQDDVGATMPGNGVGNIVTRFPRLKLPSRYLNQRRPSGCTIRKTKWKHLLAPLLVLLLFALLAELDGLSQPSKRALIAVLADPLGLLSERSPGLRGAGPLHSSKGSHHERVLSTVRDRQPPAPIPNLVASIPIVPQQYDMTENQLGGFPPLTAANGNPGSAPEGLFANPPAVATTPPETTAIPEPPSWTTVGGPLVVGVLVRQYVRKRRQV